MNPNSAFTLAAFLFTALRMSVPLTLAGIGETISEKVGILNIGIEGIMLMGAFMGFLGSYMTGSSVIGLLLGVFFGIVIALIHGFLSINARGDQNVIGLAINFLVLGLTSFVFLIFFGQSAELPSIGIIPTMNIPVLSQIPFVGEILFRQDIIVYLMYIILTASMIILYRTEWGVQMTAVGENPKAADNAGIDVVKARYLACIINGALGGLAGAYMTVVQFGFFIENITAGRGYIALAAVTLGRRNPLGVFLAALVIGGTEAIQFTLQTAGINIPSQFFTMLPYVVSIIVLLLSIGKSSDPSALGRPFVRDER